ncbi:hypothetical protein DERP_006728 [Dermatophagoides pteronyssinus]|uniref:Uncharacterized protein n=1 Tax=Dermatophagoides pteronyssinus TaxID=6956 RepID=A0ABQ8IRU3_DERPT|nr:hypothetical protein DERP_006728 [Dermatophagoides pteronyssinus]
MNFYPSMTVGEACDCHFYDDKQMRIHSNQIDKIKNCFKLKQNKTKSILSSSSNEYDEITLR